MGSGANLNLAILRARNHELALEMNAVDRHIVARNFFYGGQGRELELEVQFFDFLIGKLVAFEAFVQPGEQDIFFGKVADSVEVRIRFETSDRLMGGI